MALAGCGGGDDGNGGDGGGPAVDAGTELASTADVPVGGGLILSDEKIVLTQPTEGEFRAFTAVCTHQSLLVTSVADGQIHCANHGSVYDADSGEPVQGPAPAALAPVEVTVEDDRILAV
ncbi:Rieske (2Fe-2S) protein [Nocardioides sp. TF02-7]|uniref:Rieske (2Fe-2S) protein n=1 Tax=Nocardioides sp. TF02-7 TaxID=2917724 RepID=UPI001F0583B1|nr:Rieske (2Fe-2S) protein [Nocardioides sp. TF02-7]UMG92400.1 Rieske (2Fe-2S) protein [Nocardioides sp. TF02-7]